MMSIDQLTPPTETNNNDAYDDDDVSFASTAAEQIENFMLNLCNLGQYVVFESDPYAMTAEKVVHTNPLSDAISRHDWQAAKKILKDNPSFAQATSSCDGMIPLHQALDEGSAAPEKFIKKLLEAYPQAAHTKCGEQNRLPIHYYLASFKKATSSSSSSSSPSESIVSLLIDSFPESTRAGDASNQYPIHLACQATQVSEHIFALLLNSYPEGAIVRDVHGNYPCDYATWNTNVVTKEIALAALVQNDATAVMRRNYQGCDDKMFANPRIFDEPRNSARTQRRKRLQNENFSMLNESFSIMTEYNDEVEQ